MGSWIVLQSLLLTSPAALIGGLLARARPKLGMAVGATLAWSVVLVVVLDVIAFQWIGHRFLSAPVWRVATTFRDSLTGHVTRMMVLSATVLVAAIVASAVVAWIASGVVARRSALQEKPSSALKAAGWSIGLCVFVFNSDRLASPAYDC